jgi:hypothetical protein
VSDDLEARARRRAEITRLLARYPHLDEEARRELTDWFAHEASSLDVAMLSCHDGVAEQYRAFRAEHIDRLRPRDWARGLGVAAVFVGLLAAVLWRAF